jgi:hypothetical protein
MAMGNDEESNHGRRVFCAYVMILKSVMVLAGGIIYWLVKLGWWHGQ